MDFCPKCGTILIQRTKYFACPKCNYVAKEMIKLTCSEKFGDKKKIEVLKGDESNVWPVIKATCPECGHDEAYSYSVQMRSGDEGETTFYKCTKCKHTWREYS